MANIFLSYAREDLNKAKLLAAALESEGWSVFWDRSSLLAGQDFDSVIEEVIKQADCMIVVWSSAAKQSDWVRGEATIGRERKILVPILLEPVDPPIAFRSLHTENFVGWQGDKKSSAYLALCKALNARLDKAKPEAPVASPKNDSIPAKSLGRFGKPPKIIAITGLLVLVIAWISYEVPYMSDRPAPETTQTQESAAISLIENKKSGPVQLLVSPTSQNKKSAANPITEPEMVRLPDGTFDMGSNNGGYDEKPVHTVTIASFLMSRTEITFDDYDRFVEATGKPKPDDNGWGRGKQPVINISWYDAVDYAEWLSKETGKHFHLPTEAQWEYAARAGSTTDYYWQDSKKPDDFAWFNDNAGAKTHPVGEKQANAFGLYDMAGNVWEWVQDCWHENYKYAPDDGSVWQEQNNGDCVLYVLRGGSWYSEQDNLRSAYRFRFYLVAVTYTIGFRLAQD